MSRSVGIAILLVAMIVLIVIVDVAFLRDRFWLRLVINVGIVAVAAAIYAAFLRH